jgi:excisionase family DNA binding protein
MENLMTTREAAERLGLSPGTLENWRAAGKGPTYCRLSVRTIRYRPEDLDSWLSRESETAEAKP